MGMFIYSFEKLEVWQLARKLVTAIYRLTKEFPADERFGLVSQMRRAAVSVASNIAEGAVRTSAKNQSYFYQMAFGSLIELLNQLIISRDLDLVTELLYKEMRLSVEETGNKLNALRNASMERQNKSIPNK